MKLSSIFRKMKKAPKEPISINITIGEKVVAKSNAKPLQTNQIRPGQLIVFEG